MSIPISTAAREAVWRAEAALQAAFRRIDAVEAVNQMRVLEAFQEERVSANHFAPSTGYGYDDIGRDTFERVFARAMTAETACVRPQIVNGTHALFLMLSGVTGMGDTILSITGDPYDTLQKAIGITGDAPHSLKKRGVRFVSVPLDAQGRIQMDEVERILRSDTSIRVVFAQRSRGYAWRNALSVRAMGEAFERIRACRNTIVIAVDNCYGEFVEATEPIGAGADLIAGSLIKNPGGGLAPTGGYIAGKKPLVEQTTHCLTVPGMGGEVGSYAGSYRAFYQGLFLAPHTVAQCLKSAALMAALFSSLGYDTLPDAGAVRSDIIQAIRFPDRDGLIRFCRCIQKAAPIDSYAVPEPWDMPGYSDQIIMAAGAFVQGATTELSADAPIREPFTAYLQGALTYAHGRIAAMMAYDTVGSKLPQ